MTNPFLLSIFYFLLSDPHPCYTIAVAKYAFILGSHPILSYAEIIALLQTEGFRFSEEGYNAEFAVFEIENLNAGKFQDLLGGTIKIIEIKEKLNSVLQAEERLTEKRLFEEYFNKTEGKILIGVTAYTTAEWSNSEKNFLKRLGVSLKELLKNKHSIRYVASPNFNLTSVVISDLLKDGAEIAILKDSKNVFLGKTAAVQNIRRYRERDFDRPGKDLVSGILPPKLAQMMINLTRDSGTKAVFDPFCGSGGILQEAYLMGLNIFGSDVDEAAVKNTLENIAWAAKIQGGRSPAHLAEKIKVANAAVLRWSEINKKETIIVTEPYLGPAQRRHLLPAQAQELFKDLRKLYLGAFKNFAANFSHIKKIGIVLPVAKTTGGLYYLDILDDLMQIGYKRKAILPAEILKKDQGITKRQGFLYSRSDQFILREIFVLERTKHDTNIRIGTNATNRIQKVENRK